MFKEPCDIISLKNHNDPRGQLFEMLRFKDDKIPCKGYIYCFTINSGQKRGGHYHKKKREWFSCISGRTTVSIEDKDGNKKKIILDAKNPAVAYCGPYVYHVFSNESKELAIVVSYGFPQHDPNNPDTFKIL
jgi:UDP-2-acetamido-2,6-beta-L-arabino-hexul-4-ose reductase